MLDSGGNDMNLCFLRSQRLKQRTVGDTGAAGSRSWPGSGCWWRWYKVEGTWTWQGMLVAAGMKEATKAQAYLSFWKSCTPYFLILWRLCAFEGTMTIWRRVGIWTEGLIFSDGSFSLVCGVSKERGAQERVPESPTWADFIVWATCSSDFSLISQFQTTWLLL